MSLHRTILVGALVGACMVYLATGLRFGLALHSAMPALNYRGVAYITATWPFHLRANPIKAPIPSWVFTFKEPAR